MKNFFALVTAILLIQSKFYANDMIGMGRDPNIFLNPQDVPMFYDNNPLMGMKSFVVITCFPMKNREIENKLKESIQDRLKKIGEVLHLKDNDMRGFGAENVLLIQVNHMTAWDGGEMPYFRISLAIETFISMDKTGIKTFPMVWSISNFLQRNIQSNSDGNLIKAIQNLMENFVQSYEYVNRQQIKRPVFYTYD